MEEEKGKIEFVDKRRIKSADDTCDDAEEADLERLPTFVEQLELEKQAHDERLKEYIAAHKEKMAEMDRVRKRLEEDVERRAAERLGELVTEFFPVMDDFDRALATAAGNSADDPLVKGVEMLRARLFEVLTKHGLEVIDCGGAPFDPEVAQAVAMVPVEEDERDNTVVEQLAPGYRMGGRVLRAALVRVGRKQ